MNPKTFLIKTKEKIPDNFFLLCLKTNGKMQERKQKKKIKTNEYQKPSLSK